VGLQEVENPAGPTRKCFGKAAPKFRVFGALGSVWVFGHKAAFRRSKTLKTVVFAFT